MSDEMMSAESLLSQSERLTEEVLMILRKIPGTLDHQKQLERNQRVSMRIRSEIAKGAGAEFATS